MTYPKYCTSSKGSHCVFSEVGRPRNLTANRKSSAYCMDGKFKVLLLCLKAEYALPPVLDGASVGMATEENNEVVSSHQEKSLTKSNAKPKVNLTVDQKVQVHFRATGGAPILRKTKFAIQASRRFSSLITFLKQHLKSEQLFLFCASTFSPSPDETIWDLYQCFQINGELVVNYCFVEAW
eukprot:g1440.t1